MNIKQAFVLPALAGFLFSGAVGCSMTTHKPTQATVSPEGVVLTASNARCAVHVHDDKFPPSTDARGTVDVKLTVENTSNQIVTVAPQQVRLAEQVNGQATETVPMAKHEVSLVPGERTTLALNYPHDGPTDCGAPLALLPAGAVSIDGKPLNLEPIPLVATH